MSDRLIYLPLGGAGEIGMNAYVYGYGKPGKERLILVDIGVTFPNMDSSPGVNLILPDVTWLAENKDRLEAILITHAHEDHIGALAHLHDQLGGVPIYVRKFTGNIARRKLNDKGIEPAEILNIVDPHPAKTQIGPFGISFLPMSHSIPESSSLIIDTPAGRVIHTGDFKLDKDPVVGESFDEDLWKAVSKDGVLALVCDSTNVFSPHPGRSESTLGANIEALIKDAPGMVVATTFASNVARLKTIATAAKRSDRSVLFLGRAMRRMIEASVESGVLTDFPSTVSPEDAPDIPRENLLILATGSQGERRAATAGLSRGKYLGIELKAGDLFLFSSKTIPGNERGVINVMNALSEKDVDIVDDLDGLYHVSGHANRPDLIAMHKLVNPQMIIPMHGEHRHLRTHCDLAKDNGYQSILPVNGTVVELSSSGPKAVEFVETGRTYLDGTVQIGALDGVVRDRIRMALNGHVLVTQIIDEEGDPLGEPWVETMGLPEMGTSNAPLVEVLEEDLSQFIGRAKRKTLADDDGLEKEIRRIVRNGANAEIGRKPEVTIVISRLS